MSSDERNVTELQVSTLLAAQDAAWKNIQHNENLRNALLGIYLVISSAFLAIVNIVNRNNGETPPDVLGSATLVLLASIVIGVIGITFIWVFLRLREMINRDVAVTEAAQLKLAKLSFETTVLDIFSSYRVASRTIISRASVTIAFIVTAGSISSSVVSLGIHQLLAGDPWTLAVLFTGVGLFYIGLYLAANRLIKGRE